MDAHEEYQRDCERINAKKFTREQVKDLMDIREIHSMSYEARRTVGQIQLMAMNLEVLGFSGNFKERFQRISDAYMTLKELEVEALNIIDSVIGVMPDIGDYEE